MERNVDTVLLVVLGAAAAYLLDEIFRFTPLVAGWVQKVLNLE